MVTSLLCIFYGHELRFTPAAQSSNNSAHIAVPKVQVDDCRDGLSAVEPVNDNLFVNPYLEGDPDEIIREEDHPFTRFKLPPEEEEVGSIRTGMSPSCCPDMLFTPPTRLAQAWVVDIPDQRHLTTMLKCVSAFVLFMVLHSF